MKRMTPTIGVVLCGLVAVWAVEGAPKGKPVMKKLTPILTVDRIEPALEFWTEKMGFTLRMQVPDGDQLAFAIVGHDLVEIMYQTRASVEKDAPDLMNTITVGTSFLYLEVGNVDDIIGVLNQLDIVKAKHETFYGMTEVTIREPGGHLVTFASPTKSE